MYDRKTLLDSIRPSFPNGRLHHAQIGLIGTLLEEVTRRTLPVAQAAYIMAPAQHETASYTTMHERGAGRGRAYGDGIEIFPRTSRTYYGRGYAQLTWLYHYASFTARTGIDLVRNPDLAAEPPLAARIICDGMIDGLFTGRNLGRHVNATEIDFVNARRVVNGADRADDIAAIAETWRIALDRAASTTTT